MNGIVYVLAAVIPLLGVLGLWIGALYDKRYANVLYKLHLLRMGIGHMLFSTDKRFPSQVPSPTNLSVEETKTVIFVRHAESAWNLVFNKGIKHLPTNLSIALQKEMVLLPTLDSVFFDAPLSLLGAQQAADLRAYLQSENAYGDINLTEDKAAKTVIVSSNLRRALSTATIAFWDKVSKGQKIYILSSLQEVTFNIDGISLAKPKSAPQLSDTELQSLNALDSKAEFESEEKVETDKLFECEFNHGDKPVRSNGLERMLEFCQWCFEDTQDQYETIIASGHSLYFRYFFKYFLDANKNHVAKQRKMANCSVVKFELQKGTKNGKTWFRIPEESLQALHIGFEMPKVKEE